MIYTVASSKGGVGKTSCVYNLSYLFGIKNIIELDPHGSISIIIKKRKDELFNVYIPDSIKDLMKLLASFYNNNSNHVFIDCGGFDSNINQKILAASNLILTPSSESLKDLNGLRIFNDVLRTISKQKKEDVISYVFPCKTHHSKNNFKDLKKINNSFKHLFYIDASIPNSELINKSDAAGETVIEAYPDSGITSCFIKLYNKIRKVNG